MAEKNSDDKSSKPNNGFSMRDLCNSEMDESGLFSKPKKDPGKTKPRERKKSVKK